MFHIERTPNTHIYLRYLHERFIIEPQDEMLHLIQVFGVEFMSRGTLRVMINLVYFKFKYTGT